MTVATFFLFFLFVFQVIVSKICCVGHFLHFNSFFVYLHCNLLSFWPISISEIIWKFWR